jgi:hypothetical protein
VLDQDLIVQEGKYAYELAEPTEEDLKELEACTQGASGTLIRITKLHHDFLPRSSEIVDGLTYKAESRVETIEKSNRENQPTIIHCYNHGRNWYPREREHYSQGNLWNAKQAY